MGQEFRDSVCSSPGDGPRVRSMRRAQGSLSRAHRWALVVQACASGLVSSVSLHVSLRGFGAWGCRIRVYRTVSIPDAPQRDDIVSGEKEATVTSDADCIRFIAARWDYRIRQERNDADYGT